mgnify:CR=1 FL=1
MTLWNSQNDYVYWDDNGNLAHRLKDKLLGSGEKIVSKMLKSGEIDFRSMIAEMADTSGSKPYELLIGSLCSRQPWRKIEEHLKILKPSKNQGGLKKLKWIGANTRYWGVSESFTKAKDSLLSHQKNKNENCYDFMMYLPCDDRPNAAVNEEATKKGSTCISIKRAIAPGASLV